MTGRPKTLWQVSFKESDIEEGTGCAWKEDEGDGERKETMERCKGRKGRNWEEVKVQRGYDTTGY